MLKLSKPLCPECGHKAIRALVSILGDELLHQYDDDGHNEFHYADQTDVCWDSQEQVTDADGNSTVSCGDHSWQTKVWDPDVSKRPVTPTRFFLIVHRIPHVITPQIYKCRHRGEPTIAQINKMILDHPANKINKKRKDAVHSEAVSEELYHAVDARWIRYD